MAANSAVDNQGNQNRSVIHLKHTRLSNTDDSISFRIHQTILFQFPFVLSGS